MNRTILIVVSLLFGSFPAFSGTVAVAPVSKTPVAAPCERIDQAITTAILEGRLATLFSRFEIDPLKQSVYIVAVDHRQRQNIFAFKRGPGPVTVLEPLRIVRDADGLPEVPIPRNGHVIFVLANTNPPLYSLTKTTTAAPIPNLGDLAAIAVGAGKMVPIESIRAQTEPDKTPLPQADISLKATFKPVTDMMLQVEQDKQSMIRRLQYGEYGDLPSSSFDFLSSRSADVIDVFKKLRAARALYAAAVLARASDADLARENAEPTDNDVLSTADKLLEAEFPTTRTAVMLDRLYAMPGSDSPCNYTAGLIFADTPDQIPFDRIGTVKVTISEVNPFGVNFDRRPDATGEQSFRIADPVVRRIAVSVGGIYTPLVERSYGAVTSPLNPNEKVITRTGEQRRSGAVALLAAYRWRDERALLRPGVQFGVGFGSQPQLFTGFSLDVSPFVRLGLGATGQYVQDLASGQKALEYDHGQPLAGATVVATDSEIRLKQRPRFAPYLSLSISLDSLSLFRKP